jgi:hypothetical protein
MHVEDVFRKLGAYTLALREGLDRTSRADERPLLTERLAAAAEMYALLHEKGEISAIRDLVASEVRAHGRSFISGQSGKVISARWAAFTDAIDIKQQGGS